MGKLSSFIANSDYPFDMITYYKEYSVTMNDQATQTITFAHNLPYKPLLFGVFSKTPDFASSYTLNNAPLSSISVSSDSTNIRLYRTDSFSLWKNKKIYFRIYGFAPITWTGDCAPTARTSSNLLLDTDRQYCPLVCAGAVHPYLSSGADVPTVAYYLDKGYTEITGNRMTIDLVYDDVDDLTAMIWLENLTTGYVMTSESPERRTNGGTTFSYPMLQYLKDQHLHLYPNFLQITTGMRYSPSDPDYITHFRIYANGKS